MGSKLGDYEVLRALKSGGMGEVLLARRRGPAGFERLVAVKTIRAELAGAAAVRAMFLDEAKLLARLAHPGIAQVFDFGEADGGLFLVMEYVPGLRFREFAERRPPAAIAAAAVAEAARGVHAAHELRDVDGHWMGVVHRDLSPENLMLAWDGHVKVLDFGIALVKGRQAPVTEVGTVKGKPPYMSPEQVQNQPVDRRSDVFALGLVLHELLTGQPVFDGDSIYAVARNVVQQAIAPPSTIAGPLPPGLDAAVMAALDRDLARRTASAAELAESLERVVAADAGESLAAWAARELAGEREAHRRWLAEVVARATGQRAAVGRPSGVVTALSGPAFDGERDDAAAELRDRARARAVGDGQGTLPASPAAGGAEAPALPPTRLDLAARDGAAPDPREARDPRDDDDDGAAEARRHGWMRAYLIVHVALLALAVYLIARCVQHRGGAAGGTIDANGAGLIASGAGADARDLAAPSSGDAAAGSGVVAPPDVIDAGAGAGAAPADARRRVDPIPPPHPRPDARAAEPPPVDHPDARAAEPPPPAAAGSISFTAQGKFAEIHVDGKDWGPTPAFDHAIPAGHHEIDLINPDDGTVRLHRSVDIAPGGRARVDAP